MSSQPNKREIIYFNVTGTITEIGELLHIQRINLPDLYKRVYTLETADGQRLFPEIRNVKLKLLDKNQIQEGDLVRVEFSFEGSQRGDKRYNNIYTNNIEKV